MTPARRMPWRTAAGTGLALLAVTSLALNVALARAALHYFELGAAVRLDPVGLKTYGAERNGGAPEHPLVFFGDSRAFMWSPPAGPLGYPVVNRGISYQTTAQMVLRLDADVLTLAPAVVVFEGGVNDLKAIASFPEKRAEIIRDCEHDIDAIVRRCVDGGAIVVLVTVFDIGDVPMWRRPFWSNDVAVAVHEVNGFLATLAGPNVVLFDANALLEDSHGAIRRAYQLDYLHVSPAGYAALNRRLVPIAASLPRLLRR